MQLQVRGNALHVLTCQGTETIGEVKGQIAAFEQLDVSKVNLYASGAPISDQALVSNYESTELDIEVGLPGGKVHGSLARAGKVRGQTPKVEKQEKRKKKTGRAKKRMQYNKRFANGDNTLGGRRGPNSNST